MSKPTNENETDKQILDTNLPKKKRGIVKKMMFGIGNYYKRTFVLRFKYFFGMQEKSGKISLTDRLKARIPQVPSISAPALPSFQRPQLPEMKFSLNPYTRAKQASYMLVAKIIAVLLLCKIVWSNISSLPGMVFNRSEPKIQVIYKEVPQQTPFDERQLLELKKMEIELAKVQIELEKVKKA